MRTLVVMAMVAALAAGPGTAAAAAGRARARRCCVTIEDPTGAVRPWCLVLNVRGAGVGPRRLCRLLGGRPERGEGH